MQTIILSASSPLLPTALSFFAFKYSLISSLVRETALPSSIQLWTFEINAQFSYSFTSFFYFLVFVFFSPSSFSSVSSLGSFDFELFLFFVYFFVSKSYSYFFYCFFQGDFFVLRTYSGNSSWTSASVSSSTIL